MSFVIDKPFPKALILFSRLFSLCFSDWVWKISHVIAELEEIVAENLSHLKRIETYRFKKPNEVQTG